MWNIFCSKIPCFSILFFFNFFYYFWHFLFYSCQKCFGEIIYYFFLIFLAFLTYFFFYFTYPNLSKYSKIFYGALLYGSEILSKNYAKVRFFFFKKSWYIWNPKFHQNWIIYYFFLIFLEFLAYFFFYFTYPNLSKNSKNFCGALLYGLQILWENSGKLLNFYSENRDIWNTKHFQNSVVYYLLFYFLVFLTSFFLFFIPIFVKKFLKFFCVIVWIWDFIKGFYKTMVFFF